MALGTTATIALGLSVASGLLTAYGQYRQSQAAKDQANYKAAVSRNNRIIAEREAEDLRARGREEVAAHRRKIRASLGASRARFAEQGVELGVAGTPEDILSDTALLGELDVETIRGNAERAAYGREVEATNYGAQAGLFQAEADAESPFLTGATSLLTSAGNVASQWWTFQNTPTTRRVTT